MRDKGNTEIQTETALIKGGRVKHLRKEEHTIREQYMTITINNDHSSTRKKHNHKLAV